MEQQLTDSYKTSVSKYLNKLRPSFMKMKLFLVLILEGRKRPRRNVLSICGFRDRRAITGGSLRHYLSILNLAL